MVETPNYDAILKAAQPLIDAGFEIEEEIRDDQRAFGNALLVLTAQDLAVRLSWERGERLVDIAFPDDVTDFVGLHGALGQIIDHVGRGPWSSYEEAVQEVLAHRASLPSAIAPAKRAVLQYWTAK